MQKHVNLVDLVKSFPTNIYLQNLASIQKRTSAVKFAHLAEKSGKGSISNLSTKVGLNLNGWLDDLQAQPSAGLGSAVYALGNATSLNSTLFNHTLPNQMSQPDFVYGGVYSLCWAAASAQNGSSYALQLGFIAVGGPYRADYVCHREYLCVVAIQGFNLKVDGVQIASG